MSHLVVYYQTLATTGDFYATNTTACILCQSPRIRDLNTSFLLLKSALLPSAFLKILEDQIRILCMAA